MDFRLKPCPWLLASDASSTAEASVVAEVGEAATSEFHRHSLEKGLWSKLLRPEAAYRREKGSLELWEEMPGEVYKIHPLWQEICRTLPFRQLGKVVKPKKRRHINLGEIDAALQGEAEIGKAYPDSFYIHLQDSQVSLGAMVKGRASSLQINRRLSASIPQHISSNLRPFYGFVDSAQNPADDPTRSREVRKPVSSPPEWLTQAMEGELELFDEALRVEGVHPDQLSGLPPQEELLEGVTTDFRSSLDLRRERRCQKRRKEVKKEKCNASRSDGLLEERPSTCKEAEQGEQCNKTVSEEEAGRGCSSPWSRVVNKLLLFREDQFLFSSKFSCLKAALDDGPGILDLFSGSRGHAKALQQFGARWVLCFDIKHHSSEDLSSVSVQQSLVELTELGAFDAMGAGPVCASFSTAITPPVRSLVHPEGVPWASELQKEKNLAGNSQLKFVLRLVLVCCRLGIIWWVENPDGSWMWRQTGELSWDPILREFQVGDLRLDYCRFGTRWRKRTRFRTSSHLAGQVLRGRCKEAKMNYTQLAEAYPRGVSRLLAAALLVDSGQIPCRRKLDVSACAKFNGARIGEALNPGPRRPRPRDCSVRLADVSLLEPGTIAIRSRIWAVFESWRHEHFNVAFNEVLLGCSELLVQSFVAFGFHCFETGMPLHYYRQFLAHVQREFLGIRALMAPAWEVTSKWEILEPCQHRPPIPEPLVRAMACVGIAWKWDLWVAALLFSFYGATRVGEILGASRGHILTPEDLLTDRPVMYLQIVAPKSRRRGASKQYATVETPEVIAFLESIWGGLQPDARLFPLGPGAFRTRWNAIMKHIGVASFHRLTPGSLREGGAVFLHRAGLPLNDVLWRMRLQHQRTLSYYLQEVTASSILPSLSPLVRNKIKVLHTALPVLMSIRSGARSAHPSAQLS